ncbi:unnamed protein product [Meloidogyne enterolobii]|uniref:Uncharacterized protein n=1 Tax=Meloidogyne enterolobii TaxID=390850 RepID=A0ACB1A269_MELEN
MGVFVFSAHLFSPLFSSSLSLYYPTHSQDVFGIFSLPFYCSPTLHYLKPMIFVYYFL